MMPTSELITILRTGAQGLDSTIRFLILDVCERLERKTKDNELLAQKIVELRSRRNKTNADRIRDMSDEELVAWAHKQIGCGFDYFPCGVVCDGKCEAYSTEACDEKILKWLKQPVEDQQ